ncbi:MAG TPA: hypothetical protein VJU34_03225 [Phenylobacterium sp.]|nr:hypothetical protein [Phenylobacterium sp.]
MRDERLRDLKLIVLAIALVAGGQVLVAVGVVRTLDGGSARVTR